MNVSVVVPAFNAAAWIEETLNSVLRQGDGVEVIVIDDHSGDKSADIARTFLERNAVTGTVLTTDKNRGPSHARNLGWQHATAEWIQFLDADDLLAPGKLDMQHAVAASAADDVAVLYSPWQRIGLFNDRWSPTGPVVRSDVDGETVPRILADRIFGYVGPTLIRRRALEASGGFASEMTLGEDFDLMLRLAMSGFAFRSVSSPEPMFFYRDTPASLWQRSAIDPSAVMRLMLAVRDAENYLQRSGAPTSTSTKQAIAARYTERLDILHDHDLSDFDQVVKWISDLHLRTAPPGSRPSARLLAMTAGLSNALRLQFGIRRALRSLQGVHTK